MRNVKDQVYAALCAVFDNVSDDYPRSWANLPAVQYTEEDNRSYERTGEGEERSYIRYRVDIWDNVSTSEAAVKTDAVLGCPKDDQRIEDSNKNLIEPLGLVRTFCSDVPDPSGLKHKQMRYEGIINFDNDFVEWTN